MPPARAGAHLSRGVSGAVEAADHGARARAADTVDDQADVIHGLKEARVVGERQEAAAEHQIIAVGIACRQPRREFEHGADRIGGSGHGPAAAPMRSAHGREPRGAACLS